MDANLSLEEEARSSASLKSPKRSQSQLARVNGKILLPSSTQPNIKILNGVSELPIFGSLSGICKEQMEVIQTLRKTEVSNPLTSDETMA